MSRPLIGLTVRTMALAAAGRTRAVETAARAYVERLEEAGALAFLVPNTDPARAAEYAARVDGVVLTGGDDVHPALFDESPHPRIDLVDERRDRFEIELIRAAEARGVPVLGICRGAQVLNVAYGGDLWQDVPSQVEGAICHAQRTLEDAAWHDVEIAPGTLLAEILGARKLPVNSFHHQACRRVGAGLRACATAADGVIEAVEAPAPPFRVGVQWHAELARDEASRRLFSAFVEGARSGRRAPSKG